MCFGRAQRKGTPMKVQNDARNVPQGRGVEMRVARVTWATTATTASGTGGGVKPFALGRAHGIGHHANVRRTQAHGDHPQRRVRAAPQPAPSSGNVVGPGTQRRHGGFERGGPSRVAFGAATATTEDGQDVAGDEAGPTEATKAGEAVGWNVAVGVIVHEGRRKGGGVVDVEDDGLRVEVRRRTIVVDDGRGMGGQQRGGGWVVVGHWTNPFRDR